MDVDSQKYFMKKIFFSSAGGENQDLTYAVPELHPQGFEKFHLWFKFHQFTVTGDLVRNGWHYPAASRTRLTFK
jgi:hypothetical protein